MSESTHVEIVVAVYRDDAVPSGGPHPRLFSRTVGMPHAPGKGDMLHLLRSDEEPDGRLMAYVKDRYWTYDGRLMLEIQPFHVDPTGLAEDYYVRAGRCYWSSSADGDLYDLLVDSGYTEQ